MDQFYKLLEYLVNGIIANTDLPYFLILLFGSEMLKNLTVLAPDGKRAFKFYKKLSFQFRYAALIFGILMIYPTYLVEVPDDLRAFLLKIGITYAITTSFYELISSIIFKKTSQVLRAIKDAKVQPMVIDPNQMMPTGYTGDSSSEYDPLIDGDATVTPTEAAATQPTANDAVYDSSTETGDGQDR